MIPPPFGGAGADIYSYLIALEAIGRSCPATAVIYNTQMAAFLVILAMGSNDQKENYLKPMAAGKTLCAIAASETGGGTNPMSITTFAHQKGDILF